MAMTPRLAYAGAALGSMVKTLRKEASAVAKSPVCNACWPRANAAAASARGFEAAGGGSWNSLADETATKTARSGTTPQNRRTDRQLIIQVVSAGSVQRPS